MGLSTHTSIEGEAYSKMPSHLLSPNLSNQFVFRLFSASAGQSFWPLKALNNRVWRGRGKVFVNLAAYCVSASESFLNWQICSCTQSFTSGYFAVNSGNKH